MTSEEIMIAARRKEVTRHVVQAIAHSGLPVVDQTHALAEAIAVFSISMAAMTKDHTAKQCAEYLNKGVEIFLAGDAEERVAATREVLKALHEKPTKLDS